jgi:hypothetical protein
MKLSQFKNHLSNLNAVDFKSPNGEFVPQHFHVTEFGLSTKHFIDCGGTVRLEKVAVFQLWVDNDLNHRLSPEKLLQIIALSEKIFGDEDLDLEVEYQTETVGKYGLDFNGKEFVLSAKQTACLAEENCGISPQKSKPIELKVLNSCTPGSGCC